MRRKSDLSNAERNPQASQLRKPITIRLEEDAIDYFKSLSERVGIPYRAG